MTGEEAIIIMNSGNSGGGGSDVGREYSTDISIVREEPVQITGYSLPDTYKIEATIRIIRYKGTTKNYNLDVYPFADSDGNGIRLRLQGDDISSIIFYGFYPT